MRRHPTPPHPHPIDHVCLKPSLKCVHLAICWLHASYLSEVSRVVLVEVDPVVVLSSSVAPPSRMLPVLADPTVPVGDVAAKLAGLLLVRRHDGKGFLGIYDKT